MDKYIGVKLIEAEPMTEEEFRKGIIGAGAPGYKVVYPDRYESWSPKDTFEKAYMKVIPNPRLLTDLSISQQMVDDFIKEVHVTTLGSKTTLVRCVLANGFEIIETSACVDPHSYSEQMGKEACLNSVRNKVWYLLGFLLQCGIGGVK